MPKQAATKEEPKRGDKPPPEKKARPGLVWTQKAPKVEPMGPSPQNIVDEQAATAKAKAAAPAAGAAADAADAPAVERPLAALWG